MYAVIVALTLALPATDVSMFAPLQVRAILAICKTLEERSSFRCKSCDKTHHTDRLTLFAINAVRKYKRHGRQKLDFIDKEPEEANLMADCH
jgi:hypothetical protein